MTGALTQPHTHAHKLTCSAVVAAAARKVVYAAAAEAAAAFSAGFQCRRRRRIRIWLLCALVEIEIKIKIYFKLTFVAVWPTFYLLPQSVAQRQFHAGPQHALCTLPVCVCVC